MVYLLLLAVAALFGGIALALSFRQKKTAAEKERERRLKIHAIGRICDGSIVEVTQRPEPDGGPVHLLHYHYSVGGVNYSAAQDISALREAVRLENCSEGMPASVKYDPQNPSNSIVICELWSGLRPPATVSPAARRT